MKRSKTTISSTVVAEGSCQTRMEKGIEKGGAVDFGDVQIVKLVPFSMP